MTRDYFSMYHPRHFAGSKWYLRMSFEGLPETPKCWPTRYSIRTNPGEFIRQLEVWERDFAD